MGAVQACMWPPKPFQTLTPAAGTQDTGLSSSLLLCASVSPSESQVLQSLSGPRLSASCHTGAAGLPCLSLCGLAAARFVGRATEVLMESEWPVTDRAGPRSSWQTEQRKPCPVPLEFQNTSDHVLFGIYLCYKTFLLFLKTRSGCVAQAGLKLTILLPQPPGCSQNSLLII
jgi:hypothetical protein